MQASRSGDPWLYINTHVHALSGGFLQFRDFSVCLWAAGEQALRSCPRRGVCSSVSLQRWEGAAAPGRLGERAGGLKGLQGAVQSKGTPSHSSGEGNSWQLDRRQSAEPPLVFSLLSFIADSLLLFSFSFSFQSALLPLFSFPLHSSHRKPQPAATLSQGNSSHPCVFLIALDTFNNEREQRINGAFPSGPYVAPCPGISTSRTKSWEGETCL